MFERLLLGIKSLEFGLPFRGIDLSPGKDFIQIFDAVFDRGDLFLDLGDFSLGARQFFRPLTSVILVVFILLPGLPA